MKKLSTYEGEEALDLFADLVEPFSVIIADKEFASLARNRELTKAVKVAIKSHKPEVLEILARLDGEDPATYKPSFVTIPLKLLEIMNDPALIDLFKSQAQSVGNASSGSATASIEAVES